MKQIIIGAVIMAAAYGIERALAPRRRKETTRELICRYNRDGWPPETGGWV